MYQSPKLKNAGRYRGGKPIVSYVNIPRMQSIADMRILFAEGLNIDNRLKFLASRSEVDQLTVNQPVDGSIPSSPAIFLGD
jgi:hypothetical protein